MTDFWPDAGHADLARDDDGGLLPTPAWWRRLLQRPELAPVPDSCAAERRLHQALLDDPARPVAAADMASLADADARDNYRVFSQFRDRLQAAGTLQACYRSQFRAGAPVTLAPPFIELLAQNILRELLDADADAYEARAAEMLFRPQRITLHEGRVLAADSAAVEQLQDSGGFGDIGRLLAQARMPLRSTSLRVLGADNQADYWCEGARHGFVLDLTPTVPTVLAHGLSVPVNLRHSGLAALGRVLQRWVAAMLGVAVRITPQPRIADEHWRWHVGLDAQATALLNALYRGETPDDSDLQRLIGLYTLVFENPAEMRADLAGKPVYLALAMDAHQGLRLKPQNLLLNLPLARGC